MGEKRKEILFRKFSKNLQSVRKHLGVDFEKNYQREAYVCPLSFQIYNKQGVQNKFSDQLTDEHVPPDSLGGKVMCLTSKDSNSKSGHLLDTQLLNHIQWIELNAGVGEYKTKFKFESGGSTPLIFSQSGENSFSLLFKPTSFHPGIERALEQAKMEKKISGEFFLPNTMENRLVQIALLRVAYLYTFGTLGYSYLFGGSRIVNLSNQEIREQIERPKERVIQNIPIFREDFPDDLVGVNLVHSPKEIRGIFTVFDLTLEKKWRFGVMLPGLDDYGLQAYSAVFHLLNKGQKLDFQYVNQRQINLEDGEESLSLWRAWEKLNGWTYAKE
jgi:hypothetical protein